MGAVAQRSNATVTDFLWILGKPVRWEIIAALAGSPKDVSTLSDELQLDLTTVSRHLKHLFDRALVDYRCDKKRHIYSLTAALVVVRNSRLSLEARTLDGSEVIIRAPLDVVERIERRGGSRRRLRSRRVT